MVKLGILFRVLHNMLPKISILHKYLNAKKRVLGPSICKRIYLVLYGYLLLIETLKL